MAMKIPGLYVSVSGDLSQLKQDLKDGTAMVAQAGDEMAQKFKGATAGKIGEVSADIARAYGDGAGKAITYVQGLEKSAADAFTAMGQNVKGYFQDTIKGAADWVSEHKVLLGTLAAATAAVWAYNNQDTVTAYWDSTKKIVTQGVDDIKAAYDDLAKAADPAISKALAAGFGLAAEASMKNAAAVVDLSDKYARLSAYTGRSVDDLQTLGVTAKYTGVSFDSLNAMLDKISQAQAGASDGAKAAAKQFAAFGVTLKNNDGSARGQIDVLTDLINAETKFGDNGKKVAAERVIFGEQLNKDTHYLLTHAATWDTVQKEVARINGLMTQDEMDYALKYKAQKDQEAAESQVWAQKDQAVYVQRAEALSAIQANLLSGQTSWVQALSQGWDAYLTSWNSFIGNYLSQNELIAQGVKLALEKAGLPLVEWVQKQIDGVTALIGDAITAGGNLAGGFVQGVSNALASMGGAISGALSSVGLTRPAEQVQEAYSGVAASITATADGIKSSAADVAASVQGSAAGAFSFITKELQDVDALATKAVANAKERNALITAYAKDSASSGASVRSVGVVPSPSGGSKGTTNTDLTKFITDLKNSALSEQASFLGDTFGAKDQANIKNYEHELLELQKKLEGYSGADKAALTEAGVYWAKYRKGVADAALELEHARAYLKEFGQTQEELGQLTGDVESQLSGKIIQLELDRQDKIKKIENDSLATKEQIAVQGYNINALYSQKETDEKLKALGDAATLDAEYWTKRETYLGTWLAKVKKYITDENDQEAYAAKKRSDLRKEEIDARIGYESSFSDTLKDVLSSELGLYKDTLTQEHDAWVSESKEIATGVKDFSSTAATGITSVVKGWITGTGTMQDAFKSAMDGMLDYLMTIVQKMIKYALENYVTIPIVESLVGSDAASAITGKSSSSSSTGLLSKAVNGISDLFSGGSTAADAALTSGMLDSSITGTGAAAVDSVASPGTLSAMSAGVPSLTNGMGELTSGVGVLAEATEGVVPAATSLGVSLGTVATGIGALVGVGALLVSGFSETKTSVKTGSGYSMGISGTSLSATGEDYYKNTTSSMFGGTSTSHSITNTGALDSATNAQLQSEWSPYATTVTGGFKSLGIGADVSGFQWPQTDVTEDQKSGYYRNMSNAMTLYGLKQQGLAKAFEALAGKSEYAVDELSRLSSAFSTVNEVSKQTGLSLENLAGPTYLGSMIGKMAAAGDSASSTSIDFSSLSGVMDDQTIQSLKDMQSQAAATGDEVQATNDQLKQLALAQYASELVTAFGSSDNVTAAYSRYFSSAYSATEQADRLLEYYGTYAGTYIGTLNDASVNLQNFWSKYREAMEGGSLSAGQVKAWDDAAQYVQAYDTELKSAGTTWVSTNKDLIDGLKDQIKTLQDQADAVQATLDLWSAFLKSIKDLRQAIAWDSNLTNLSKKQILDQMTGSFTATAAKAKTGDATAIAELPDLTKEYLAAAKDYYGASADYFATFDQADAALADLQDTAQAQTDLAQSQLDALNGEVAVLNVQVDQLNLVNTNLGTLANAVGDGVTAIVSAIGDSTYSSGYAASISAADAAQQVSIAAVLAAASVAATAVSSTSTGSTYAPTATSDLYSGGTGVTDNGDGTYTVPGFASGGDFSPGLAMVGENGPELVRFNKPGSVANSRETASLMSNKGVEARLEGIFNLLADPVPTKTDEAMLSELSALRIRMAKLEQRLQG